MRFCQVIWQIFTQGRAKKKIRQKLPPVGIETRTSSPEANALPTELSQHSITSLNLHGLYKVMLYWFLEMNKSNMWSGSRNKQSSLQKSPAQQISCLAHYFKPHLSKCDKIYIIKKQTLNFQQHLIPRIPNLKQLNIIVIAIVLETISLKCCCTEINLSRKRIVYCWLHDKNA